MPKMGGRIALRCCFHHWARLKPELGLLVMENVLESEKRGEELRGSDAVCHHIGPRSWVGPRRAMEQGTTRATV